MKQWIHFPTGALHLILLVDAAFTINHYSDFFLISTFALLIGYFILLSTVFRKKAGAKAVLLTYLLGCVIQFLIFSSGIIDVNSGAFGLGGGEFALLFYAFAMAVSCGITAIAVLLKLSRT